MEQGNFHREGERQGKRGKGVRSGVEVSTSGPSGTAWTSQRHVDREGKKRQQKGMEKRKGMKRSLESAGGGGQGDKKNSMVAVTRGPKLSFVDRDERGGEER